MMNELQVVGECTSSVCMMKKDNTMISDLPDEVLEYILSLLPPYRDLEHCTLVCKRWKKIVESVILHSKHNLLRALANFDIRWEKVVPVEKFQSITKRYSHSACCYENSMYIFGGCTCTSTFNDLWKLDLSTRKWSRLLTMGTYPSPKACATLVYHEGTLLLFGGWTHPSPYPLHQASTVFNELHIYDVTTNRWCSVTTPTNAPPPMAGHSATVHNDKMVVFGGLQGQNGSSNDVWCFNLYTYAWYKQDVSGVKPQSRYGQSQITLDNTHLLILGGCGGGPNTVLNDVWLLTMDDPTWTWRQVTIKNPQWAASHLWCHPACKVGSYVVVCSRNPGSLAPMFTYSKWRQNGQIRLRDNLADRDSTIPPTVRRASESVIEPPVIDRDVNVNGRRGSLTARAFKMQNECEDVNTSQKIQKVNLPSSSYCGELPLSSPLTPPSPSSSSSPSALNLNIGKSPTPEKFDIPSNSGTNSVQNNVLSPRLTSAQSNSFNKVNLNSLNRTEEFRISDRIPSSSYNKRLELLSTPMHTTGMAAFRDSYQAPSNSSKQRLRQLEALRRIEERLRNKSKEKVKEKEQQAQLCGVKKDAATSTAIPTSTHVINKTVTPKMALFILDISQVLTDECYVTWLPIKAVPENSPEDMILYTLVPGNGELIMFGGIQKDVTSITQQSHSSSNITTVASNAVHFIIPPHTII